MKITSFGPQIIARDMEPVVEFFEGMGFKRIHTKENIGVLNIMGISLENEDGFRLDISQNDRMPVESIVAIRINVDDFDEAYQLLTDYGFKNYYGDDFAEHPSSKSAVLISPSLLVINLVKHITD